jgi:hypothetical protein
VERLQEGIVAMRDYQEKAMNMKKIAATLLLCTAAGTAGAVGRIADVTVYDRTEGRMLPVYQHGGRHYVVGKPGNEYQVRLDNRTGGDVLTVVSVDGVNASSGETANWEQSGYILASRQGYDIRGWRKSMERIAAFYFTEHQNSYASRTGRPQNVGVIGVAVFRRKAEPEARIEQAPRERPSPSQRDDSPYPADEESSSAYGSGAAGARSAESLADSYRNAPARKRPSLGTGHGRIETSRVTYTSFERAGSNPDEVVVIHYDTYANLVAQGVIRAPRFAQPRPFPGQFVPDPR